MRTIVVFDDWETWQMADGATVIHVSDKQFKRLEEGEYPKNMRFPAKYTIQLKDLIKEHEDKT